MVKFQVGTERSFNNHIITIESREELNAFFKQQLPVSDLTWKKQAVEKFRKQGYLEILNGDEIL